MKNSLSWCSSNIYSVKNIRIRKPVVEIGGYGSFAATSYRSTGLQVRSLSSSPSWRSLLSSRDSLPRLILNKNIPLKRRYMTDTSESTTSSSHSPRLPRSVQAAYLRPLRRSAPYGSPSCDLQLRSYSARNLEHVADFVMRTAYYLGIAAAGPVPLPRLVERWTVSRSVFAHKKSQENFERITLRRLIQVKDAHIDTVHLWLAFIRKHAYYGVGMKANIWEHEKIGLSASMDGELESLERLIDPKWDQFGRSQVPHTADQLVGLIRENKFRRTELGPFE